MQLIRKRALVLAAIILIGLAAVGEWLARSKLGLGNPPLSVAHPTIEYLFKPNQDVKRFDNGVRINAYGMRSNHFSATKPKEQFRVLVFGDSVLNGGNLTDQADLATELLADRLEQSLERPVVVGNVSAGSWGPGNWLGYAREYGFFDADVVILLISTHDHRDNPTFASLNPHTHPQNPPVLAVWEGITRYLPRYLPLGSNRDALPGEDAVVVESDDQDFEAERGIADLEAFLRLARDSVPSVVVAQFLEKSEVLAQPRAGHFLIRDAALQNGVPVASTEPWFRKALETGPTPFSDNIHLNAVGHKVLAGALWDLLCTERGVLSWVETDVELSPDEEKFCP
jgi:lysophospholipase L1-like esterase